LGGAFDPPSCQGRSLHLRAEAQRPARSSAAPLSRSIGLKSYASVVLGSRALYSIPNGMWKVASPKVVSRSPQTHTRVNKGRRTS
jgi:hypothetical protein